MSTSARSINRVSTSRPSSLFRSSAIDSLLRLHERKYVLTPSTNGGPQPRVSSPPSGVSTLITRAPWSPSIIAACGPAGARERSTTRTPSSGPVTPASSREWSQVVAVGGRSAAGQPGIARPAVEERLVTRARGAALAAQFGARLLVGHRVVVGAGDHDAV